MYYVISLYHSEKHEKFLTVWQADNKGYCFSKEMAGLYESPIEGYHNSDKNMAISVEQANQLFILAMFQGQERMLIPNNSNTWKKLGLRFNKRLELRRIIPYETLNHGKINEK